jgi:hypothetical protein
MLAPHSLAAAALGRNKRGRGKREGDFKGQKKIAAAPQRRADAQADKVVNLVAAMEAEEKCMLEALQKLDEARKAAQMQCQVAHERLREREQENQRLCVRASEALKTADARSG